MAVTLGSNISSLRAQRRLSQASEDQSKISERLASGQRINRASDDAAGLSISEGLRADVRISNQAIRNVNDGISLLNIAEGAIDSLTNIITRIAELSEQAANGVYTLSQRKALHREADELRSEYNRVVSSASFNNRRIFDPSTGAISIQSGKGVDALTNLGIGSSIYRNISSGQFDAPRSLGAGLYGYTAEIGDFNGDGNLDVFTQYGTSRVLLGNGDGTFRLVDNGYVPGFNRDSLVIDYNGDGFSDIIAGSATSGINVLVSNGNGTFRVAENIVAGGAVVIDAIRSADLNGDGLLDIAFASQGYVHVAHREADGTFGAVNTYSTPYYATHLEIGDINSDNRPDVVVSNPNWDGVPNPIAYGYLNDGSGRFSSASALFTAPLEGPLAMTDVNRDGFDDILINRVVALGNGDGSFKATIPFITVSSASEQLETIDMNGDNLSDFVIMDSYGTGDVRVNISNGDGTFKTWSVPTSLGSLSTLISRPGDFNNDGAIDIIAVRTSDSTGFIMMGVPTQTSEIGHVNLMSAGQALSTLEGNRRQIQSLVSERAALGATRSRLEVVLANLQVASENFSAAAGRITDADIAGESADLARQSILQQAAVSVLAQANQQPALALRLLQL